MSTLGGPKIVTSGLVYAVDAADLLSFRGEPTTNLKGNLFLNQTSPDMNYTTGVVTWETMTDPFGSLSKVLGVRMPSGGANNKQWYWTNQGNYQGQTLTLSWWARSTDGTSFTDTMCIAEGGYASGNTVTSYTVTPNWQRFSVTRTINTTNSITLGSAQNSFILDKKIHYWGLQLEAKSYPTTFTNGTRGTSVVDGGGLGDMSNSSGDGTLVNGPRESQEKLGCIVFDGTDDRIDIANGTQYRWGTSPNSTSYSIEAWVNITTTKRNPILDYYTLGLEVTAGGLVNLWYKNAASFYSSTSTTTLATNTWYHIVGTHTNGGTDFVYVNGQLDKSTAADTVSTSYGWVGPYLGYTAHVGGVWSAIKLASCKMYNRQISAAEVAQNFNATRGRFGI